MDSTTRFENHSANADMYYSTLLGCEITNDETAVVVCESDRRAAKERGYRSIWPVVVLRRGDRLWASAAPGLGGRVMAVMDRAQASIVATSDLAEALKSIVSTDGSTSLVHSLICLPSEAIPLPPAPMNCCVRPLHSQEQLRAGEWKTFIPQESIAFGTAFGVFVEGELVSWAEATPLELVTDRLGVMPVGIETQKAFRRRGFARAALSQLTKRVESIGKTPLYDPSAENAASQMTALSCGYKLYGEVLRVEML